MGLWVREAGVEDVQYRQVPCFLMDLRASASSRGVHIMCTMWNLDICHVYTVKLFHSCCQLHLQDRVQANKVFHTRLVLTVHWLLCRSVIGSLSPTWGKTGVSPYLRPRGLNMYYIFQNIFVRRKIAQKFKQERGALCFMVRHTDKRLSFITIMPAAPSAWILSQ